MLHAYRKYTTNSCRDDVEGLFAPVVNEIIRLVAEQRAAAQKFVRDIDVSLLSNLLEANFRTDRS